jgi:pimeloyl-ACP methyl ester carboxylesterase
MTGMPKVIATLAVSVLALLAGCPVVNDTALTSGIDSLDSLSIQALRNRDYGSVLEVVDQPDTGQRNVLIATYQSDGLGVYSRIDIPETPAGEDGYPVVIFVHGWIGIEAAPSANFYLDDDSNYDAMIRHFVDAGFVVFTPGWRGHGTVNGRPADGIEFMRAWDNGSYLSPVFYAVDVLNLLDSLPTFDEVRLDLGNTNLVAHSQGGDVALIALAIAGEGSKVSVPISAASIWSGCFPSRFVQLETYEPMQKTPQAFLSGDGTWTGTAVGASGEINPAFVFGYPADWIGTPVVDDWTWQRDTFSQPSVAAAIKIKLDQMYSAINTQVGDIDDARYELIKTEDGKSGVLHDTRVSAAYARIDAYYMDGFLTEQLVLQHSDRDFYSFPEWNEDLCRRVNLSGGECFDFEYVGNTHSLRVSENRWFSGEDTMPGFLLALRRDVALFTGKNPTDVE